MNKEKLYQTNIYTILEVLENRINYQEKVFENNICNSGNSFAKGYHSSELKNLNNFYCLLKDLQIKTFHGKEFREEQIKELLNEQ